MFSKKDLIYFAILLYIVYKLRNIKKIEKMSNSSSIRNMINNIYNADIQAIRNLSEISKKLQSGGLTIPGNVRIKGTLHVDRNVGIRRPPHPRVGCLVNGSGLAYGLESTNNLFDWFLKVCWIEF